MPLPVITDHFYVAATFQNAMGEIAVNTFCFRNDQIASPGDSVPGQLRDLLDQFYGDRTQSPDTVGGYLSPALFGLTYVIYNLGDPDGEAVEIPSATWPTSAGSFGSAAPPDLAITISWQTAKRGRSFRGRTYLGPLTLSTAVTGPTVNSTARSAIAAAGAKLIGDPLTRMASLTVLSRTRGVATPVTGGYVDDAFDTQRRRDPGPSTRTLIVAP